MARRSIRKRRHHGVTQRIRRLAEMANRADLGFLSQAARFERAFVEIGEAWRETYSAGPDVKPSGTMTVVSVSPEKGAGKRD